MKSLSVIIPSYNEGAAVKLIAEEIQNVLREIPFQIIFVDDGSTDNTWTQILSAADDNENIGGIKFSKNFGKESAILAGLTHATGDACAVMDCDLQHPPDTLIKMYNIWRTGGVDIVEGIKASRGNESAVYKKFAKLFYYLLARTGNIPIENSSDFQLLDRRVVDILIKMPERQRFFRALSAWAGFNREQVEYPVADRHIGVSKFNFYTSTKYALSNIASFSSVPMQFVTFMGICFFTASAVLSVHTFYMWIAGKAVEGFTTVILLLLIIGSMLMISMGIIGLYIAKIYEEIKQRPPYIIESDINMQKADL